MLELEGLGTIDDIVISTRVRLARNILGYKMPEFLNIREANELSKTIVEIVSRDSTNKYDYYKIREMDELEKTCLVEDHIISPKLYGSILSGGFLLRQDRKATIMLNEEDHLRIQLLEPGLHLEQSWEEVSLIDDFIEEEAEYAFHEKFGYITSCPTNVGTGLRASVMLHLPAISITKNIDELVAILRKVGLTLRGLYGEGTQGIGSIYQISNQRTLGRTEEEIISKLEKIIRQVIDREREMRMFLLNERKLEIEDRILRSYGIIKNNRKIEFNEAMSYLSNIKLGADLGIVEIDGRSISKLMSEIQPAKIQWNLGKKMNRRDREIARSKYIIEFLNKEE